MRTRRAFSYGTALWDSIPPKNPSDGWFFVAATGRWFYWKEDGKKLVVGDDGGEPPCFFFAAYRASQKIGAGEGFTSVEEAQLAAEEV